MGILDKQLKNSPLGIKGETPEFRQGALDTSQLHAQEVNPTKMKAGHSIYDLDGKTPPLRSGASILSQLHAQGTNPTGMKGEHSVFDLNGKKPSTGTYRDNAPEGANF